MGYNRLMFVLETIGKHFSIIPKILNKKLSNRRLFPSVKLLEKFLEQKYIKKLWLILVDDNFKEPNDKYRICK